MLARSIVVLSMVTGFVGMASSLAAADPLSDDQVISTITKKFGPIKACYQKGLAKDPALRGRIVTSIKIKASGAVASVTVATSMLGATVDACIVKAVKKIRFPAADDASTVQFPFLFTPD
jgi:TonB family protein